MGRICSAESAIATCDSYNWPEKLKHKHETRVHNKQKQLLRRFSYSELESATSGFSASSFLGKGSHGAVYRAALDSGTVVAAVKRSTLSSSSLGSVSGAENEIEILSKLRGPGFVNLLGYGVDPTTRRLLLVVEHMPNGSLYDLLHKSPKPPGWAGRVRFAFQVARAVDSLHSSNPPVIHRDIKSSNVLIDGLRRARLGDFGLALRGHMEDVRALSTPPAGTLGYLDPCYLVPGDLSAKSDVFSFGILLLEIISGRRAIDVNYSPSSVEEWALPLIKVGKCEEIYDRRIGSPTDRNVIKEMSLLAVRCIKSKVEKRPSMVEVVDCLKGLHKRVRSPVWNGLRRRVVKSQPLIGFDLFDEREETQKQMQVQVRRARHGNRRSASRSRKVSSVPSAGETECETTRGSIPVGGRYKSLGSAREINVGSEANSGASKGGVGPDVGVKLREVKFGKSRAVLVMGSGKFKNLLDGKIGCGEGESVEVKGNLKND